MKGDLSGVWGKDFAQPSPPFTGRASGKRRSKMTRTKGSTRVGRRVPPTKPQIAFVARVKDKQAAMASARAAIKFPCQRCGRETSSALAVKTLCHICVAEDACATDVALYGATTRKMARYAAQGRSTGAAFRQAMRIHDRILKRLLERAVPEADARKFVEKMLEDSQKLGGRIAIPKLGDLLRNMGVKVEA